MFCNEFCHLKHVNGLLPAENRFELIIGIDISLVF